MKKDSLRKPVKLPKDLLLSEKEKECLILQEQLLLDDIAGFLHTRTDEQKP